MLPGEAPPQQATQTSDTRFGVGGKELRDEAEKFGSEDRSGLFTAQFRDRTHELEATEPVLAVVPDVVQEDERTVGPAGEDWMVKVERLDDSVDVVGPLLRVVVSVRGLVRQAMTSHIQRD